MALSATISPLSGLITICCTLSVQYHICVYYVYVLMSEKDGNLYIGYTPNLKDRIHKHESGYVTATKERRPLQLIYYESYLSRVDAKKREIYLKGGSGHNQLKTQLEASFKTLRYQHRF